MGKISILDCTLRDGGYINDWRFGKGSIDFILRKLSSTGIEFIEIGFIKGNDYSPDRTVYPDVERISSVIPDRTAGTKYVGMVDMSAPVPIDRISVRTDKDIDAIRVIFKQDRISEGYEYVRQVQERGYLAIVQLVSTNTYSDDELAQTVKRFNELNPYALYIVDSLGMMKKRDFMRRVQIVDENLAPSIALGYHSHNNLQQARGNAEALAECGLERDIIIDATVFGMGRGAGNLNMELFSEYLNENFDKNYRIEPMLEIIDQCLMEIYKENFWGYSLPYYLSASNGVHPNYAKYYSEKDTLTERAFSELLRTIEEKDKPVFSKSKAEEYYIRYMENYVDDSDDAKRFSDAVLNRNVLIVAPGANRKRYYSEIKQYIKENDPIIISVGFIDDMLGADYIFCSNLRKYEVVKNRQEKKILTSNIKVDDASIEYIFNYAGCISQIPEITDNSGIMILKILMRAGIRKVSVVGMDGFSSSDEYDEVYGTSITNQWNEGMRKELNDLRNSMEIRFLSESRFV